VLSLSPAPDPQAVLLPSLAAYEREGTLVIRKLRKDALQIFRVEPSRYERIFVIGAGQFYPHWQLMSGKAHS